MRVTSNLYPEILKSQVNNLQSRQLYYENQVATGLKIQKSSDDPTGFHQSQILSGRQANYESYLEANQNAESVTTASYSAMSDLQRLLTRASELVIRANGSLGDSELNVIGEEMESIVDQIVDVANRTYDGRYLFGGTGNVAPVTDTGLTTAAGSPVYAYTDPTTTAYSSNVNTINISETTTFETGIVAGSVGASGGAGDDFDGFLVSGSLDILSVVQNMRDQLMASPPTTPAAQDLVSSVEHASTYVGKMSSRLSALELNESTLDELIRFGKIRIDDITGANLADAITELQRTQTHYQAALQSGAKILNISLLNYIQ